VEMGGLGPNKDFKWTDAQNKLEKMKNFSHNIGRMNHKNIKLRRSPQPKEKSKRDRMLEFASLIKKPKINSSPERFAIGFEESMARNKYFDQELDDQKLRLEKEKIRMIYHL
jgi:hypothetical protein